MRMLKEKILGNKNVLRKGFQCINVSGGPKCIIMAPGYIKNELQEDFPGRLYPHWWRFFHPQTSPRPPQRALRCSTLCPLIACEIVHCLYPYCNLCRNSWRSAYLGNKKLETGSGASRSCLSVLLIVLLIIFAPVGVYCVGGMG